MLVRVQVRDDEFVQAHGSHDKAAHNLWLTSILDRKKEVHAFDAFSQVAVQDRPGGRGQAGSDGLLEGGQANWLVAKVVANNGVLLQLAGLANMRG